MTTTYKETVLPDDYPVYFGYIYVANDKPLICEIDGNISQLKRQWGVSEIKSCDLVGRNLF